MSDWATKETLDPTTFIQWKDTYLCADFYCVCGEDFHIDAEFCQAVLCPYCNRRYELSTRLELREIPQEEIWIGCEIKVGIKGD